MTTGYMLVQLKLGKIIHSARRDHTDGYTFTACGLAWTANALADHGVELSAGEVEVSCMSCLVRETGEAT